MKYLLNKQGYGSLVTATPEVVTTELVLEIPEAEGDTVKLVTGEKESPFYARVEGGKCTFPVRALVGDIGVSVISNVRTVRCAGLIAIKSEGGVTVVPDAREVLERLTRVERDISDSLVVHDRLEEKYKALEDKLSRLFDGYNF